MSDVRATTRSTERSQALFAKAQEHLAGGVGSGTRSPRSGWRPSPIYVDHATGSRVIDVDGNEYIDYQMGQGPLILGHRPPSVLEAVTRTINERGSLFALAHDLEAQAADAVSARMPSMETLRFGNSGSECVAYALRFARAATGRTLVLRFEGCYHGWTDGIHWSAHPALDEAGPAGAPAVVPATTGIPPQIAETLAVAPFNDLAALERMFAERGDEIAAAIIEPIMGNGGGVFPAPGFLERLRELTSRHGSVLIFDEVLTGMRVGPGGAQGLLGVTPDLTVLAKALAAGFPVAAVGGRRDLMEVIVEWPHDARRHVQLERHGLCGRDRGQRGHGASGLLRRPARPWRSPRRRARGDRPRGGLRRRLLHGRRIHVPALAGRSGADRLSLGPGARRREPVPGVLRRDARAARDRPAAAGGPLPGLRRAHGRRHRSHARGGGCGHARRRARC